MVGEKIKTGIPGFDPLIEGGFEAESINVVAGGGGSGKSTFAMQYLVEGLRNKESVLYITFEEKKEDFFSNVLEMGYDLAKAEQSGKFIFLEYSPEKVRMMLDEGGGTIESIVLKNKITRLVFDSITSFALLFEDEQAKRQAIASLFGMIRKWELTTLLTAQYDPLDEDDEELSYLEFEADSITLLYYPSSGGTRNRFVEVLKMRGSDHSKDVHVFKIGKGGITVGPKASIKLKD